PRARLECSTLVTECTWKIRYAAMNPKPVSIARMKQAATIRSAPLAPSMSCGSAGSSGSRTSGRPAVEPAAVSASSILDWVGDGVPMIRRLAVPSAACGSPPSAPRSAIRFSPWLCSPGLCSPVPCPAVESLIGSLPVLRSDPHSGEHHEEQQSEEGHEPFGHRPDPAEAEPTRVRLLAGLRYVGDDVALLLRGDRGVVEHRHRLRPGQHSFKDLSRSGLGQRRRVLAVGQGTAGALEVMALRAVGGKELLAESRIGALLADLSLGRNGRTAAKRGDVRDHGLDLRGRQLRRLAVLLWPRLLGGHPAGRELEVPRGRADADEAR